MRTNKNSGFTLVEILIVVVILGILAAIVIPQFSQASLEARESTDLQGDAWIDQATSGTAYGPYMRVVPDNPFSNGNTVDGSENDWLYTPNAANGTYTFVADDGGTCPDGTLHSAL